MPRRSWLHLVLQPMSHSVLLCFVLCLVLCCELCFLLCFCAVLLCCAFVLCFALLCSVFYFVLCFAFCFALWVKTKRGEEQGGDRKMTTKVINTAERPKKIRRWCWKWMCEFELGKCTGETDLYRGQKRGADSNEIQLDVFIVDRREDLILSWWRSETCFRKIWYFSTYSSRVKYFSVWTVSSTTLYRTTSIKLSVHVWLIDHKIISLYERLINWFF